DNGALMFPAKLSKRGTNGRVEETDVRIRVPRPIDHLEARRDARAWLIALKIDADKDPHLLEQAEDMVLLAFAIRTFEAPHGQLDVPEEIAKYDEGCLRDIKLKIQTFKDMLDPRDSITSEEQFWEVLAKVRQKRNLLPL